MKSLTFFFKKRGENSFYLNPDHLRAVVGLENKVYLLFITMLRFFRTQQPKCVRSLPLFV